MKSTIACEDITKPPRVPLWRNRDYMLLWSGQTVSLVGTVISQTAFWQLPGDQVWVAPGDPAWLHHLPGNFAADSEKIV